MGDSEHEVGKALKSIVLYGVIHPSSNFAKKKGGHAHTERISTTNLKVARPCLVSSRFSNYETKFKACRLYIVDRYMFIFIRLGE